MDDETVANILTNKRDEITFINDCLQVTTQCVQVSCTLDHDGPNTDVWLYTRSKWMRLKMGDFQ